jgi:hypothetical protein
MTQITRTTLNNSTLEVHGAGEYVSKAFADVVIDDLEKALEEEIINRDYWEEKATDLAMKIGEHLGVEVGEHSNMNCPIQNAFDAIDNA